MAIAGCGSLGPASVPRDRIDYIDAVSESWKEQTLLNIVRLRYGDAPTFLEVSSVISGYTIQGQLSAGASIASSATATIPSNLVTLGGNATYIDRPTITYTPLSGDKFARSLLQRLPPSEVLELVQAGYPADAVLMMTVRAINGIYNRSGIGGGTRDADPRFYPLLDALRRLQQSGIVSLRLEKQGTEQVAELILASERSRSNEEDLRFIRDTLGARPDKNGELSVAFGLLPRSPNEIAILTRSMVEILLEVASGIEVPGEDVVSGRTAPSAREAMASDSHDRPLIRIRSSALSPASTYSAVQYRGIWYWIDDRDIASKRVFTFLMLFFSLAETGVTPQAPVLTIPAN